MKGRKENKEGEGRIKTKDQMEKITNLRSTLKLPQGLAVSYIMHRKKFT